MRELKGSLRALGGCLRELEGSLRALGVSQRALEGSLQALGGCLRELEGSLRALGGSQRALEGPLRALEGSLRELEGSLRALEGPLRDLEGSLLALAESLARAEKSPARARMTRTQRREIFMRNDPNSWCRWPRAPSIMAENWMPSLVLRAFTEASSALTTTGTRIVERFAFNQLAWREGKLAASFASGTGWCGTT